jgi:hypothetical protein
VTLSPAAADLVTSYGPEAARIAARGVLWEHGDLSWALHADQVAARGTVWSAFDSGVRRAVLLCGRRWGKTRLLVVDAVEFALKNPKSRILYAALTWSSAQEFVLPELRSLSECASPESKPKIVDGDVFFPNGSTIIIRGCEDRLKADRLRGPKAHRAYVDEAGFIEELDYVVRSVVSWQLLTTDGCLWLASSPPVSAGHPFVGYVADAEARGAFVRRRTRDAPHITPEALEKMCVEMGGPTSTEWLREGEAQIVTDATRAVIPEWLEAEADIVGLRGDTGYIEPNGAPWPDPPRRHWYVAADLGYLDLTVVLLGWWDFERTRYVIEDERVLTRPTSADVQAAAAEMEREHGAVPEARVADAPAITIADLARLQHTEEAAQWRLPWKDDKEGAVNAVRLAVSRREMLVHPRCRHLVAHCRHAVWNKQRTDFERSADLGHYDAVDALVYFVRTVDRTRNPEAPRIGVQPWTGVHVPAEEKGGRYLPRGRIRR